MLPIVDCLKLDNMDAVQVCMDRLEPWLELTETGDINFSLNAVNGFIGGTVGVIGTVIAAGIKKDQVKERLQCVYCEGSGQIMCGHCLGTGKISYYNEALGELVLGETCPNCEGTGTVVCINCQGSGMSVPDDFLQVLGDEEVSAAAARANTHTPHPSPFPLLPLKRRPSPISQIGFTEEDYIGLFDETPIPKGSTPTLKIGEAVAGAAAAVAGGKEAAKEPAVVASTLGSKDDKPGSKPIDYTGGLG